MLEHERILHRVAREAFRPAGFLQRGRSRTWLDDHGWWLTVIELQPSGHDRGSYLNVGAMWLAYPTDFLAFHDGHRRDPFVRFRSPAQFEASVLDLCTSAVLIARGFGERIRTFADAHARQEQLLAEELSRSGLMGPWNLYFTALFALLADRSERGDELAGHVAAYPATTDWEREMKRVASATFGAPDVGDAARAHVEATRRALKLPPIG
jgi:hypothetical protein